MAGLLEYHTAENRLAVSSDPPRTLSDSLQDSTQLGNALQVNLTLIAIAGCLSMPFTQTRRKRREKSGESKSYKVQQD